MKTTNPQNLRKRTKTDYPVLNNEKWFEQNVILRKTPIRSISAFATKRIPRSIALGEYVGEFLPASPTYPDASSSSYHFAIENADGDHVGNLDSLRVGSWTPFVNHSSEPNTEFELKRVGEEARVSVVGKNAIEVGEKVSVHYGG